MLHLKEYRDLTEAERQMIRRAIHGLLAFGDQST
jgi:hypothetical protein